MPDRLANSHARCQACHGTRCSHGADRHAIVLTKALRAVQNARLRKCRRPSATGRIRRGEQGRGYNNRQSGSDSIDIRITQRVKTKE
ncbi:MAG: hypothetical protein DME53_05570 [Verrucomicrobia bacterium]|nr:MAG: hypothetical protein DME53_05570 [Verrucomicrobiota bacterium]